MSAPAGPDPRLDPELVGLLDLLAQAGRPLHAGTPQEARAAFRTMTVDLRDPALLPQVASVEETAVPGGDGPRPARVYRPREGTLPTVVLLHGGGWVIGDLDTHDLLARTLARGCDAVVVSVDYRLAPEHPFPAAVEDAVAAVAWAADHLAELGGGEALGVAGDSAGGNLATVAAQAMRDRGVPLAGQLLIYPGTDFVEALPSRAENGEGFFLDTATILWFAGHYLGPVIPDLADPRLSPLRGELSGLPPAVVVVAELDPLRDEGTAYAEALAAAGVEVAVRSFDGLIHGFADMGRFSRRAQAAVEETCELFRGVLHGASQESQDSPAGR